MKRCFLLLFFLPVLAFAESMYSPTWGFSLDLPEGYDYVDGNSKDRFSFMGPGDIQFDLLVYNGTYNTIKELVDDVNRRLGNRGDTDFFVYRDKQAAILELSFGGAEGWGLCVELKGNPSARGRPPMLLVNTYGVWYLAFPGNNINSN